MKWLKRLRRNSLMSLPHGYRQNVCGDSEDARMDIFDAVGLAVVSRLKRLKQIQTDR